MKEEDAEFNSFLSDFVLKTILLIRNKKAKKSLYDVFSYVLKTKFEEYDLSFNEIPKYSKQHGLIEINPKDLETVKSRNLSYLLKMCFVVQNRVQNEKSP